MFHEFSHSNEQKNENYAKETYFVIGQIWENSSVIQISMVLFVWSNEW